MTSEEIAAAVDTLPHGIFGPNARASIGYLMKSRDLSLNDAIIEFEHVVADSPDPSSWRRSNAKREPTDG